MKSRREKIKDVFISNNKKLSEDEKRKVYYKYDSSIIYEFFIFRKENITKEIGKKYLFIENNNDIIMSIAFEEKLEKYKEYCEECEIKKECKFESEDYCIANWVNFKKIDFYKYLFLEKERSKVSEEFLEKYKEEIAKAEERKYFILVEKIQDVLI